LRAALIAYLRSGRRAGGGAGQPVEVTFARFRLQIADCGLRTADCPLPIAAHFMSPCARQPIGGHPGAPPGRPSRSRRKRDLRRSAGRAGSHMELGGLRPAARRPAGGCNVALAGLRAAGASALEPSERRLRPSERPYCARAQAQKSNAQTSFSPLDLRLARSHSLIHLVSSRLSSSRLFASRRVSSRLISSHLVVPSAGQQASQPASQPQSERERRREDRRSRIDCEQPVEIGFPAPSNHSPGCEASRVELN